MAFKPRMVPAPALDGPPAVTRGGPGAAALLIAGLAVAGAGIALTAGNIHPIWIGAGLCAYLVALRAALFRSTPEDPARREIKAGELFEIVPCYISVQDPQFRIVTSNALFKRDFGDKIVLNGAVDSHHVLIDGTPESVRRDVKAVLQVMMPGGGYVAGASHDTILEETPVENVLAMVDTVNEFGRY